MGLFSSKPDKFQNRAECIPMLAKTHAIGMYTAFIKDRPDISKNVRSELLLSNTEVWDINVTIAGVTIAWFYLMMNPKITGPRNRGLATVLLKASEKEIAESTSAVDECMAFLTQELTRLSQIGHPREFLEIDSMGKWIFIKTFNRHPVSFEECQAVRSFGIFLCKMFEPAWMENDNGK